MNNENIPQWVIDYNNAGHQSSAGRAIKLLMIELASLREQLKTQDKTLISLAASNSQLSQDLRETKEQLKQKEQENRELVEALNEILPYAEKHAQLMGYFAPPEHIVKAMRLSAKLGKEWTS